MRTGRNTPWGHSRRARAVGMAERHAVLPGLVGGGADHPPGRSAHHHRLALERRVVRLLHRGEEGVHVQVQNTARQGRAGHAAGLRLPVMDSTVTRTTAVLSTASGGNTNSLSE